MADTSRSRGGNEESTHVRNEPAGRFAQVPEALIEDPDVSHLALRVWTVLRRHGDSPENCYPTHARIAEKCNVSPRSIAKPIKDLEDAGWIERVARFDANGSRISDGYFVRFHPVPTTQPNGDPAQMCATTTQHSVGAPRTTAGTHHAAQRGLIEEEREPYNESHLTNTHAPRDVHQVVDVPSTELEVIEPKPKKPKPADPPDFVRFWDLYPRKRGKGAARKAWTKATRHTDPDTIIDGLQATLPILVANGGQYVPYPATWLNAERWEDDPNPVETITAEDVAWHAMQTARPAGEERF